MRLSKEQGATSRCTEPQPVVNQTILRLSVISQVRSHSFAGRRQRYTRSGGHTCTENFPNHFISFFCTWLYELNKSLSSVSHEESLYYTGQEVNIYMSYANVLSKCQIFCSPKFCLYGIHTLLYSR